MAGAPLGAAGLAGAAGTLLPFVAPPPPAAGGGGGGAGADGGADGGAQGTQGEAVCPVCLDAWSDGGPHRICALRTCGHIFGKSCILKWLRKGRRGRAKGKGKCPVCNKEAKEGDIVELYVPKGWLRSAVPWDGELEDLKGKLDEERALRERAQEEVLELKDRLGELRARVQSGAVAGPAGFIPIPAGGVGGGGGDMNLLVMRTSRKRKESWSLPDRNAPRPGTAAWDREGMRFIMKMETPVEGGTCLDMDVRQGLMLVGSSTRSASGVAKFSMESRSTQFIPLGHSIRDLKVCRAVDSPLRHHALVASLAKSAAVLDVHNGSVCQRFPLPFPAFSCAWGAGHRVYAGQLSGRVAGFDLRMNRGPLMEAQCLLGRQGTPVHSLHVLPRAPTEVISLDSQEGGLRARSLEGGCDFLLAASKDGVFYGDSGAPQGPGRKFLEQLPLSAGAQPGSCARLGLGVYGDACFPIAASVHERDGAAVGTLYDVFHTHPDESRPRELVTLDRPYRMPSVCKPAVAVPSGHPLVVIPSETGRSATVLGPSAPAGPSATSSPTCSYVPWQQLFHHPSDLLDIKAESRHVGLLSRTCLRLHDWPGR